LRNAAAPAQHVLALHGRCEEYRKQTIAQAEKMQQMQYECKQMKAQLENDYRQQLDELRASRK